MPYPNEEEIEKLLLKRFKPGKYILYDFFQKIYKEYPKKQINNIVRLVIKKLKNKKIVKKGKGGLFYVTDSFGANPFYSEEIKLSKYRIEHLSQKDIKKNSRERGLKLLKARSNDFPFNYDNYKENRKVKNKLTSKKCRVCGKEAYCMHHIIPLSKGGTNNQSNLIPICIDCNKKIHIFM